MRTSELHNTYKIPRDMKKVFFAEKAYGEGELLKQQFNLYKSIYNTVPCYITMQDRNFLITQANKKVFSDFGTITGKHCYKVYKGSNKKCSNCCVDRSFRDGKPHLQEESVILHVEIGYFLVHSFPVFDERRHVTHVIEIATDITALKHAEKLGIIGQTMSGIAHSIKNVVSLMDAGTYIVNSGLMHGEQEKVRKGWSMIQGNIQRLSDTVICLLNYAKDKPSAAEPININGIIEDIGIALKEKLDKEHIKLKISFDKGIKPINGDRNDLYHAILNLVYNAMDACIMDKGKKPHYAVSLKSAQYKGTGCLVSIKDNGCGIPQKNKGKVFKGYFTTKHDRGTGLGLLTTEKIITGHGGMMTFASSQNGTTFSIYLPYRRH
jgi:signal transduction histidine kinase